MNEVKADDIEKIHNRSTIPPQHYRVLQVVAIFGAFLGILVSIFGILAWFLISFQALTIPIAVVKSHQIFQEPPTVSQSLPTESGASDKMYRMPSLAPGLSSTMKAAAAMRAFRLILITPVRNGCCSNMPS